MAGNLGRQIELVWDGAVVLGVREKGISLNGEPVNVTSDEDDGWRLLLADVAAEDMVDVSLSGVSKDTRLKTAWFTRSRQKTATLTWPNGDVMTGIFTLVSYNMTGPYNDAETFEASLQSSGEVTFTPYS